STNSKKRRLVKMQHEHCSNDSVGSSLINLFARRAGQGEDAWGAIAHVVAVLQNDSSGSHDLGRIESWLAQRRISSLVYERDLECDGCTQPLGMTFEDGFRMVLNLSVPATRLRFTLAHELCHTFFYEHVPELKFMPHETDEMEESLCNFGAAELLMPKQSVVKSAKNQPVSLQVLDAMADSYSVSPESMLVRLRSLRLWKAELWYWSRTADGDFVCRRNGLDCQEQWNWMDSALMRTWETGKPSFGKTFLESMGGSGCRRVRPICYDLQRRAKGVVALIGTWAIQMPAAPLFEMQNAKRGRCNATECAKAGA
ncbi:MAG TPA: ImmA/IrrE family metallo-endopeptidase, partial [Candidatus Angelobacter sp.]